jgi:hypothetical protein
VSAASELVELVERAGAAERAVLAARWKDRSEVERMVRTVQRAADEQQERDRRVGGPNPIAPKTQEGGATDTGRAMTLAVPTHADAARAEAEAVTAVAVARHALLDAHLAVLNARLARIDAGEDEPDAATVDGHTPLAGRNAVSRHGPALAHGLRGEIHYILTRKPRSVVKTLAISLALGLLYLGFIRSSSRTPDSACSRTSVSGPSPW